MGLWELHYQRKGTEADGVEMHSRMAQTSFCHLITTEELVWIESMQCIRIEEDESKMNWFMFFFFFLWSNNNNGKYTLE